MQVFKRNGKSETLQFDKITRRIQHLIHQDETKTLNATLITMKLLKSGYIIEGSHTSEIDSWTAEICGMEGSTEPKYNELGGRICVSNLHKLTGKEKATKAKKFSDVMTECYQHQNKLNEHQPLIHKTFFDFVVTHKETLDKWVDYKYDFNYDYFAFKTLERNYLLKTDRGVIIESPQDLNMRVAVALHMTDVQNGISTLDDIYETYKLFRDKKYTHATPTLFNCGTNRPQLSSCFLVSVEDSIQGIYGSLTECAMISKNSGGIGIEIHDIRSKNATIRSTNGKSTGIVPMLKVFEATARYVNQGGKRKGSIAVYLAGYHADIEEFLDLRKNVGAETERARDLFLAVWLSDLFMKRVMSDGMWSLMCPDECKGLADVYGETFEKLYTTYEKQGKYKKQIKARKLWEKIKVSLIETGSPYVHFKDSINRKNNQMNAGVIRTSNLCSEIMEVTNKNETAVCNLSSIALSQFVKETPSPFHLPITVYVTDNCVFCGKLKLLLKKKRISFTTKHVGFKEFNQFKKEHDVSSLPLLYHGETQIGGYSNVLSLLKNTYDFEELYRVAKIAVKNLNRVIDINYYPTDKTHHSNSLHRPIGLGVQGLADVYYKMGFGFDHKEAYLLNKKIFETMYFGAMEVSCEVAMEREKYLQPLIQLWNKPNKSEDDKKEIKRLKEKFRVIDPELDRKSHHGSYSSFIGSPFSQGKFQFDLWNHPYQEKSNGSFGFTSQWDWNSLRKKVMKHGTRNSLLTALMPTASTSQILGNNECFEPYTSNLYTRKTLAGLFKVVNKYLIEDLKLEGLWNSRMKDLLILNKGSIQNIKEIPSYLKQMYKTVWEIKQKVLIQQSVDRAPFIDQSQSMNLFVSDATKISQIINSALFKGWKSGLKTGLYYLRTKPAVDAIQFTIDKSTLNRSSPNKMDDDCLMCGS